MRILLTVISILFLAEVSFAYTPPAGIPDPNWTTHPIDTETPSQPSPWATDQEGYYYVDSSVTCSDTGYGNLTTPRCTIPVTGLSAGDKIFVKYCETNTLINGVSGTAASPIWIIGVDGGIIQPESVGSYMMIAQSDYWIIDGITFDGTNTPTSSNSIAFYVTGGSDYIALRNSTVQDMVVAPYSEATKKATWMAGMTVVMPSLSYTSDLSNVVYYNVTIANNAGGQFLDYENGRHGVISAAYVSGGVTYGMSNLWVLDSTITNNPEDGLQIGMTADGNDRTKCSNIFFGGNTITNNGENAIDLKGVSNVVISENFFSGFVATVYRDGATSGSDGSAGVINGDGNGPLNDWWIFNTFTNSRCGIRNQADGGSHYIIGNRFYDLNKTVGENEPSSGGYNAGVAYWQSSLGVTVYVTNNTIMDVHGGIYLANSAYAHVEGNIVSDIVDHTLGYPVVIINATNRELQNNWYYDPDGPIRQDADAIGVTDTINTDPEFSSGYLLSATSPCVDAMTEPSVYDIFSAYWGSSIEKDILLTSRPVNTTWDIGAYEYNEAVAPQSLGTVLLGQ